MGKFLRRAWLPVLCSVVFLLIGIAIGSAGPATPAAAPSPAATTAPAPAPARTTAPKPKPTPSDVVLLHQSGSGNYNSAPFTVGGANPQLVVTYTFSGNADSSGPDNFIADVVSGGGDDQNIANTIASSGGTTTRVYPEPDGGSSYHLSVQASGDWSFTVTEVG